MTPLASAAGREVEELHAAFVELFTQRSRNFSRCEAAFAVDFTMVTPDGRRLDRSAILSGVKAARATADFVIGILDLAVIREADDWVLLQYVEQQYRDGQTTRRLSAALFTADRAAPCGVVWRYLQETWMQTA
jgi:hypothetical protein